MYGRIMTCADQSFQPQGPAPHGQRLPGVVIVVERDPDLLQVVDALGAAGGLAGGLHRGQQQGDQDRDDRDHDQQLDQRETATTLTKTRHGDPPAGFQRDGRGYTREGRRGPAAGLGFEKVARTRNGGSAAGGPIGRPALASSSVVVRLSAGMKDRNAICHYKPSGLGINSLGAVRVGFLGFGPSQPVSPPVGGPPGGRSRLARESGRRAPLDPRTSSPLAGKTDCSVLFSRNTLPGKNASWGIV